MFRSRWRRGLMPCLLTVIVTMCVTAAAADNRIAGVYVFKDDYSGEDAKVRIYAEPDGTFDGRIIWLAEPYDKEGNVRRDDKNPDKALRDRPAYEIVIVEGLWYDEKKNRWNTERLYHPMYGRYFKGYMSFEDDGRLKVRGYVGNPAFGQTQYWTKIE